MKSPNEIKDSLEIISKFLDVTFKIAVISGGATLLAYCLSIGYFPSDVSIGDGLLFILIAAAFLGVYLFFVLCLTCLGILVRPLWHGLQWPLLKIFRFIERVTKRPTQYSPFVIEKGGTELFVFALFGAFMVYGFSLTEPKVLATLTLCAWGCALSWSQYIKNRRRENELEQLEKPEKKDLEELTHLSQVRYLPVFAICIIPLILGGVSGKLVDAAMRLANVRTENVIVHIRAPYDTMAAESGIVGSDSGFGPEYKKYEQLTVLFNGLGSNVVIRAQDGQHQPKQFVVPSSYVHVLDR